MSVSELLGPKVTDLLEDRNKHVQEKYRAKDFFSYLHTHKKADCKKKGLDYNLDAEYIKSIWTGNCAVFGTPLVAFDKADPNAYSFDRVRSDLGYIRGNVQFISWRANRIKYDATAEELRAIADYIDRCFEPHIVWSSVDCNGKLI